MRYLFVSDIHGEFDKLIEALNEHNFDAANDTLVVVGDSFDRGPKSYEVLRYIMSLPHCIKIWGNHDARLFELVAKGDMFNLTDHYNGVLETLGSFVGNKNVRNGNILLTIFDTCDSCKERRELLFRFFAENVWAIEFSDLIVTHGWLPMTADYKTMENWRTEATSKDWEDATWANTKMCMANGGNLDNPKRLLVGHWHAWRIARDFLGDSSIDTDFKTEVSKIRECKNTIFIDGCCNYPTAKVPVYEYFSDEAPIIYEKTRRGF